SVALIISVKTQQYTTSGLANGAGYVNLSAAPGIHGNLTVTAPDYNATSATNVTVNESATTTLATALKQSKGGVLPWGWVLGTVLDKAHHYPLGLATVQITSRYGVPAAVGTATLTNSSGQYMIDAPPSPTDNVSVNLTDYPGGNYTRLPVAFGAIALARTINLTGDGIVAGFVVSFPLEKPIPWATVTLCGPKTPVCSNSVQANGSGFFWIAGPPGYDNITVSYTNFVTTSRLVNVTSDAWIWIGKTELNEYAYISGTVIGLPSGIPVNGANVSVCSPLVILGYPICPYVTLTDSNGNFFLAVPAGNYVVQANATLYNATFIPIQLLPGERVSMGLIELQLFGFATGHVLAEDTQAAINGSVVEACPTWSNGNCTLPELADPATGAYSFEGPPGPYAVQASAPGYFSAGLIVKLVSGAITHVPTIFLAPIGTGARFTVSGTVYLNASTSGGGALVPFAGALISDGRGDATTSTSGGVFTLGVLWGMYTISVSHPGDATVALHVTVHANVTGLTAILNPQTYRWSGYVRDGINAQPFGDVTVRQGGSGLGATNPDGFYSLNLVNGTYSLTATLASSDPLATEIAPVGFEIVVNGGGGSRDVLMFPPPKGVDVLVVNAITGVPIANASVHLAGTVHPEGVGMSRDGATSLLGTVELNVYSGSYTATASASGFLTSSASVVTGDSFSAPLTVSLSPAPPPAVAKATGISPTFGVAIAGGVAALAIGAFLLTRRLRAVPALATAAAVGPQGPP
ncbi:MAG: carboxypeptidase-like regulatory domain-containing protein, partial [Thermoplasmata archaeon]|nr:carboxypeptidase-like regulatory domain-containing protein [Thermoplasmata archaeon]